MKDRDQWMDLAEEAGQLREALASRAPIEQAKGIILTLCPTDADGAFDRLRTASMRRNVKLATLAVAIVDVVATPSPIFSQTVTATPAHAAAFEALEEWGMDFGHRSTVGMEQHFASSQRDTASPRAGLEQERVAAQVTASEVRYEVTC